MTTFAAGLLTGAAATVLLLVYLALHSGGTVPE